MVIALIETPYCARGWSSGAGRISSSISTQRATQSRQIATSGPATPSSGSAYRLPAERTPEGAVRSTVASDLGAPHSLGSHRFKLTPRRCPLDRVATGAQRTHPAITSPRD